MEDSDNDSNVSTDKPKITNINLNNNFDDFDDFDKFNNENNFDVDFGEDIHIHKYIRNAKKCTTIISGLEFKDPKDVKDFLSKVKIKFGIGGCQKTIEEISTKNLVYVFMGDYREKIKQFLVKEYNKDESCIKIHG